MTDQLQGFEELEFKFAQLGQTLGLKAMRQTAVAAIKPTLARMRSLAPRGTRAHKTYKGRTVAPGFLSRSIKYKTKTYKARGAVVLTLGVAAEAFYGVNWYDRAAYIIDHRRYVGKRTGRSIFSVANNRKGGRTNISATGIKPYTLPHRPWFYSTFVGDKDQISGRFAEQLRIQIDRVARSKK